MYFRFAIKVQAILLTGLLFLLGCGDDEDAYAQIDIELLSFGDGETIPSMHTCRGQGISPAGYISNPPDGTSQFALLLEDLDATDEMITHWILWGIPGSTGYLPENISEGINPNGTNPNGTNPNSALRQGTGDHGGESYSPPCPTDSEEHRYAFKAYALDESVSFNEDAPVNREEFFRVVEGHILGVGEIIGLSK